MQIEEIAELWKIDSVIDRTDLGSEALKITKLHSKYYNIFLTEKLSLRRLEAEMKSLKLDKFEFYTQGPCEESQKKGWKLPPRGIIIKSDVSLYLDGDSDIITLSLKIGLQQEKIEFLESIIKFLQIRNYGVRNAIDYNKFISGG